MCLTEEDLGMLMLLVVVNIHMCECEGRKKGGVGGQTRGLKMGQLIPFMGPARVEVCFLVQRAHIPSKWIIFILINNTDALCYMPKNIFSPLHV
jgi:hypothetical protein